jgi:hypothetical protein
MPTPPSGRRVLERELAELPDQIAGYERELTETPDGPEHRPRRERLDWQIRNVGNTWPPGSDGGPAGGHQGRGQLAGDPRAAARSPYRGRRPSVAGEARAPQQARCHDPGGARSDGLGPAGKALGGSSATASEELGCQGAPLRAAARLSPRLAALAASRRVGSFGRPRSHSKRESSRRSKTAISL